ncbi:MAG TPA: HAD-IC family P-type ATPase [Bacilli bacterium]|nr:HAD-IC family P-type ATPase [Bacilli bacterium]
MSDIIRFETNIETGLTNKDVTQRVEKGLVNYDTSIKTKSKKNIIFSNIFTLFNLLNLGLGILIIISGSYKNLLFLGTIFLNTLISIIQEIRTKNALDKISLILSNKTRVLRSSTERLIDISEIVLDDIIIGKLGDQIVVDSYLVEGTCEVNEALVTGEANTIIKKKGDFLLSGSFIVSGNCKMRVHNIGYDNYTAVISKEASEIKTKKSEIIKSLNRIIKWISIAILPIGILLFMNQLRINNNDFNISIVNTVGALIGMIPEGLILLTSTVLAIGIVKLFKYNILVRKLYSIENLARVDTICIDKTGTITTADMTLKDVILIDGKGDEVNEIMSALSTVLNDNNATYKAINKVYGDNSNWKADKLFSFSSDKKFSGAIFGDTSYFIGAPEYVLKEHYETYIKIVSKYSNDNRVLALVKVDKSENITLLALLLVNDNIRDNAEEVMDYFRRQNVNVVIISGDSLNTILRITSDINMDIKDAIDLSSEDLDYDKVDRYNIFARVTPDVKRKIIIALKKQGHTVAMIGDGVNDVLALKEADCSIAINEGSDAARNVSDLVLMNSDFISLPKVVKEGRRIINNIERSASLFLSKTLYSIILAILFIFIKYNYPFEPIQFSIINLIVIGLPAFILALEPNNDMIKGKFLMNILKRAIPTGLTIISCVLIISIIAMIFKIPREISSTIAVFATIYVGLNLIYKISQPFNKSRTILFYSLILLFVLLYSFFNDFFSLEVLSIGYSLLCAAIIVIATYTFRYLTKIVDKINFNKLLYKKGRKERKKEKVA